MNLSQKHILFDCDGTLLKSLGFGMDAFNFALEHVGARPHTPEEIKKFFGQSADKIFYHLLGDKKKAEEAYEIYFEFEVNHVSRIHTHAGIVELLDNLKASGARMGVVTGRHSRDLELLFNHTKLHHYFEALVCDDHLSIPKPHPEGLLLVATRMNINIKDCYYVGDSVMDIQAAHAAGAKSIAALWDQWAHQEEMERELA
ncbi:MAG: HAD family hydrolase [Bdellovibrionales bacterium]|nr:HAD family hydrolase [Bdellovibrionales bacterium]